MSTVRPLLNLFNTAVKTAGARNIMATTLSTVGGIAQTREQLNEAVFQAGIQNKFNMNRKETPVVGIPFDPKELLKPMKPTP